MGPPHTFFTKMTQNGLKWILNIDNFENREIHFIFALSLLFITWNPIYQLRCLDFNIYLWTSKMIQPSVVFKGYHCATLLSSFCLLFHCATISRGEGGRVETHSRVVKFLEYFLQLQRKLGMFKINIKDRSKYCFSNFSIWSDCTFLRLQLIPRGGG